MADRTWTVGFYQDARGTIPAYEFLAGLAPKAHAAALRALDLLACYGPLLGMPHARHVDGALWELRAGSTRLFYFRSAGSRFIVLHGYRKATPKAPRREIETARRRMGELVGRG
jgi:phage-related protein